MNGIGQNKNRIYRNIAEEKNSSNRINKSEHDFKPTKVETLFLNYNAIACTCAQWSDSKIDKRDAGKKAYYWLEPADKNLMDADQLFDGTHLPVKIRVTGQVMTEKGFPKNKNLGKVNENEAGKVFRYTKIEVL